MGMSKSLSILIISLFAVRSHAYTFYVGGRDGWVLHPSESYSDWASRNRFQVNDTLVFKYKQGEDSVLEVNQQDFDQCNLSNPIQKMDTGDSVFKFDRSGPFYFISGTGDRCKQGQKLIIVVLAVRPTRPVGPVPPTVTPLPPSMAPTSSPVAQPPVVGPPTVSPVSPPTISPVVSPTVSPGPAPSIAAPPATAPTAPITDSPSPSPYTVASPPSFTPPTTISPSSNPSTQPAASQAPATSQTPNSETTNSGSAPAFSRFRISSVSFALVMILNYGLLN